MDALKASVGLDNLVVGQELSVPKLELIEAFVESLNDQKIRYCHWKSSEHLDASMTGDTDLDILFDINEKSRVYDLLKLFDFKKFIAIRQKRYTDIEDFIGMDHKTGKIVHVHAHFRLTLGENYLKGYQLNFEEDILNSRIFDLRFGIYCIRPAFEMVLLFFRYAFKVRKRDVFNLWRKKDVSYNEHVLREYRWLKQRCTDLEIKHVLSMMLDDYMPVYEIIKDDFNLYNNWKLSKLIKKAFKRQRLYSPVFASLIRLYREAYIKVSGKILKYANWPLIRKRVLPEDGLVVALLGADGSGKSTMGKLLFESFNKKIDVYRIYFGSGSSGASRPIRLFRKFRHKLTAPKKLGTARASNNKQDAKVKLPGSKHKAGFFNAFMKGIEALLIARDKRSKIKSMDAAKKKGMLVICDRFPQRQINGRNDGPLLAEYRTSKNVLLRFMAQSEARFYRHAEKHPPDVVFKLLADVETLLARKPGQTDSIVLEDKVEGIKSLTFPPGCRVVTLDVSVPLEEVALELKRDIWESLP